jgi:hypothetical protein
MGAQGTTTINFGSFPGASDTSVAVTGQSGILSGSLVEAWLYPVATADHSADEHLVEQIKIVAGNIVAGTGFTIYGLCTSQINEPLLPVGGKQSAAVSGSQQISQQGGQAARIYGLWTVAWVWN